MTIRCLVVDDHPVVRAGTISILRRDPEIAVVGEAGDCDRALLLTTGRRPHLVLLDVRLDGTLSIDSIGKLKTCPEPPRVLMLSAFPEWPLVQAALAAGAQGYVLKSASGADLRRAVHRVMAGAQVLVGVDHGAAPAPAAISPRELLVLHYVARGLSNKEIARLIGSKVRTVETHLHHIYRKLQVGSRTEAMVAARACGILPAE